MKLAKIERFKRERETDWEDAANYYINSKAKIERFKRKTLVYSVSRILRWHKSPSPKILIELIEGSIIKEKIAWMLSSESFEK